MTLENKKSSETKSLSHKLVYRYLKQGDPVYLLITVSDPDVLMEILIDSEINDDFFERRPGKYNFWADYGGGEKKLNITLKRSGDQINIEITPILTKKNNEITYDGYIPSYLLINFVVDLSISTKVFYSLNKTLVVG